MGHQKLKLEESAAALRKIYLLVSRNGSVPRRFGARPFTPRASTRLRDVVMRRMPNAPGHGRDYCSGSGGEVTQPLRTSYSGRIRYYRTDREVAEALELMLGNLRAARLPETAVSQAFMGLSFGGIPATPGARLAGQVAS